MDRETRQRLEAIEKKIDLLLKAAGARPPEAPGQPSYKGEPMPLKGVRSEM